MADAMAALLERIRTDAVEQGQAKAEALLDAAREEARSIRAAARAEAETLRREAAEEAARQRQQGAQALRHAARDLLLTLRAAIQDLFVSVLEEEVERTLDREVLVRMLEQVTASCAASPRESGLEIILSPKDKEALAGFFLKKFREELLQGVEIRADADILRGFRLGTREGYMYIDFTSQAIAESLAQLVRPALAEHLAAAAQDIAENGMTDPRGAP
ncbi:hypothetical protein [Megalodesulfovibrio paquesii]